MRYKENTGNYPFWKSNNSVHPKADVASVSNTSGASSGIFEQNSEQKDPEKAMETVQAVPARTISG
jgi:hypothetical protein